MTLGDLFNNLAKKAGVSSSDQNLINVLSNAELSKINVHSDLSNALDNNLLSIEVAKDNHPEIAAIYKAQALNALDKRLAAIAEEAGIEEDDLFKTQKNSYKKLDYVIEKLREQQKPAKPNTKETEGLQKQVDELLGQLKALKEGHAKELDAINAQRINDRKDFVLKNKLSGYKTILDQLDPDVRYTSLMTAINKQLQEHDAELVFDDSGNLIPQKKDGSKLLGANHTAIDLQSLLEITLAQNKMNVVTPPQPSPAPGAGRTTPPGQATSAGNNIIAEFARRQREAFEANNAM